MPNAMFCIRKRRRTCYRTCSNEVVFVVYSIGKREIISEKSLLAVQTVVEYLKEDVIQRDVFRAMRHDGLVLQISKELHKGSLKLYKLLEESTVRDIAGGLLFFLIDLKKPLIPPHIQAIVLDADNRSISPEVVAMDVLGLVKQEIEGRHLVLLHIILDLLYHVIKYTPTDELAGCNVPITMMPVFFNLQAEHIMQWRRVATIFVELIRLAPQQLNMFQQVLTIRPNNVIFNDVPDDNNFRRGHHQIVQRLDEMQLVLRRYLNRTGNRGDSTSYEVYVTRRRDGSQRHRT